MYIGCETVLKSVLDAPKDAALSAVSVDTSREIAVGREIADAVARVAATVAVAVEATTAMTREGVEEVVVTVADPEQTIEIDETEVARTIDESAEAAVRATVRRRDVHVPVATVAVARQSVEEVARPAQGTTWVTDIDVHLHIPIEEAQRAATADHPTQMMLGQGPLLAVKLEDQDPDLVRTSERAHAVARMAQSMPL